MYSHAIVFCKTLIMYTYVYILSYGIKCISYCELG